MPRASCRFAAPLIGAILVASPLSALTRLSQTATGADGSGPSTAVVLAAGASRVAFLTEASNLCSICDLGQPGVVVLDLGASTPRFQSLAATNRPALSGDGRWLAFVAPGTEQLFVADLANPSPVPRLISTNALGAPASGPCRDPIWDHAGAQLHFISDATNLLPQATTAIPRVYGWGPQNGLDLLTPADRPVQQHAWSSAGRRLVALLSPIGAPAPAVPTDIWISEIGSTNARTIALPGLPHSPALSADGSILAAFATTNSVEACWIVDLTTSVPMAAQPAGLTGAPAGPPALSADGRWIAFSVATAPNQRGVHLFDRLSGTSRLISQADIGTAADGPSLAPALSAQGRFIAFQSEASLLVPSDKNGHSDIFLEDTGPVAFFDSTGPSTLVEGDALPLTIRLEGSAPSALALECRLSTYTGTAAPPPDVIPATQVVSLARGDDRATVWITARVDTVSEPPEPLSLLLLLRSTSLRIGTPSHRSITVLDAPLTNAPITPHPTLLQLSDLDADGDPDLVIQRRRLVVGLRFQGTNQLHPGTWNIGLLEPRTSAAALVPTSRTNLTPSSVDIVLQQPAGLRLLQNHGSNFVSRPLAAFAKSARLAGSTHLVTNVALIAQRRTTVQTVFYPGLGSVPGASFDVPRRHRIVGGGIWRTNEPFLISQRGRTFLRWPMRPAGGLNTNLVPLPLALPQRGDRVVALPDLLSERPGTEYVVQRGPRVALAASSESGTNAVLLFPIQVPRKFRVVLPR